MKLLVVLEGYSGEVRLNMVSERERNEESPDFLASFRPTPTSVLSKVSFRDQGEGRGREDLAGMLLRGFKHQSSNNCQLLRLSSKPPDQLCNRYSYSKLKAAKVMTFSYYYSS